MQYCKNTKNYTIYKTIKRLHYAVSKYLPDTASDLANRVATDTSRQ